MFDIGFNKDTSIADIKWDNNKVEKPKEKTKEKDNISFKQTLEDVSKEGNKLPKNVEEKIESLNKKIEAVEKKIENLNGEDGLTLEEKLEIKNFLNDLKFLLGAIKEDKTDNKYFENIFLLIEQILNQTLNLIEKKDFSSLKDLIRSFSPISLIKEDQNNFNQNTIEKNIEVLKEAVNKIDSKENKQIFDLSLNKNKSEKFEKIQQSVMKNKDSDIQQYVDEKNVSLNKKEINIAKELSFVVDKKIEKPVDNIIVKNYNVFTSSLNKANIEALMAQITGKAVIILKQGKSELKMQLSPPELGRMNMKFVLEDGQLTGKIVVSTKEAFMLFDQNKESLAQSLNQAGVNIGKIDISLGEFDSSGEQNFEEKSFSFGKIDQHENNFSEEIEYISNSLYDGIINYIV